MQYNVEWLFIDYYKSADCPGNGCTYYNEIVVGNDLYQNGTIIDEVNPDIINLCEVKGINELNILQESLKYSDEYKSYLLKGTYTNTGQNVGLITKIVPTSDLKRTDNREAYPVSFTTCDSVDRCVKREGQAMVIQDLIIEYVNKDYEIVVIGDMNDYDNKINDKNDDNPISQVLNILKGEKSDAVYKLTNLNSLVIKYERYRNWWDKNDNCELSYDELVLIGHILVSNVLIIK